MLYRNRMRREADNRPRPEAGLQVFLFRLQVVQPLSGWGARLWVTSGRAGSLFFPSGKMIDPISPIPSGQELMKDLIWDKTLSVDVPEIDEDHRRLVELFNILNHSVVDGDETQYIEAVMEELISCTVWHFRHEERLMLKYGYEGFMEHKSEHEELIASAKALQQKLLEEGKSVLSEDIQFLENWLTGHILGTDMDLGSYLCEVM
jgi:hemerythrin